MFCISQVAHIPQHVSSSSKSTNPNKYLRQVLNFFLGLADVLTCHLDNTLPVNIIHGKTASAMIMKL
uniref:Uncharacterized protein n=1 Tax=Arion vulgaris TaxID=1028688 RepID=A0A0B6Y6G3_9EUPU